MDKNLIRMVSLREDVTFKPSTQVTNDVLRKFFSGDYEIIPTKNGTMALFSHTYDGDKFMYNGIATNELKYLYGKSIYGNVLFIPNEMMAEAAKQAQ